MEKQMIKHLENIKESKFDFSKVDIQALIKTLLENIGHEDPYIRDHLVYEVLAHVFHDQLLDDKTLEKYLSRLISDNFLFYDMSNQHQNSGLKRSFTVLQLVIFVYVHQRDDVISKQLIHETFDRFMLYFTKEEMLTGYDTKLGWVHAIAHSADLIKMFMGLSWFDASKLEFMFHAVSKKIKDQHHYYMFNEDERLAIALKTGLDRKILSNEFVFKWIDDMLHMDEQLPLPNDIICKNNVKQLLRSLYFKCLKDQSLKDITDQLESVLVK
jgi:hypothetical protein